MGQNIYWHLVPGNSLHVVVVFQARVYRMFVRWLSNGADRVGSTVDWLWLRRWKKKGESAPGTQAPVKLVVLAGLSFFPLVAA